MALLFLIEHARTGKRIKTSLYLSILFFILSYATKEFALLFLPAFLIGLFIAKKRNSLIVFIVGFSMYLILEVIVFKHLFGVDAGRLGILRITYDKSGLLDVLSGPGLATLFERYAIFGLEKFVFLISAMIASLYLFRYFLNKKGDIGFLLCCISLLSFLLTITFSVKSINPITPLFTFYERYLLPAYPLIAICIFYFIEHWTLKLFPLRSQNFIRYGIIALVLITCFKPNNLSDIEQNFKNFKSSLDSKKNPTNALSWNKIVNAQNSFISALSDDKVILSKQLSSEEIKYRLFIAAKDESYYMIRCDKLTNFMFIISKKLILNSSLKKLSWCEKVKNIKSNQFEMVNIYWKSPFQLHLQKNFKFQPRE